MEPQSKAVCFSVDLAELGPVFTDLPLCLALVSASATVIASITAFVASNATYIIA